MNEQSRINATISYFFLWPLFLLAKSGTPLHDPFVRTHAVRSSIIISIGFFVYLLYIFLLRPFTDFTLLGFHLQNIVLTLLSSLMILMLLRGAYQAYHGISTEYSNTLSMKHIFSNNATWIRVENEDDKVRLVASMVPLLGIYIARKYEHPLTSSGRSLGSLLLFMVFTAWIFSNEGGLFVTGVWTLSLFIFIVLSVNIFLRGEFIMSSLIERIPSYEECEAHIFASLLSVNEFLRIAFGGSDREDYHTLYVREIVARWTREAPSAPYFMPAWLIGIPFWNLFSVPSYWMEQYREYRSYILSGILITLLVSILIFWKWSASPYLLFMLFPIVHIFVYASYDLNAYIPGMHILLRLFGLAKITSTRMQERSQKKEEAHYTYTVEEK